MKLLVPGHIDPDNADNWRREAEARLRTAYASMVQFRNSLQALQVVLNNPDNGLTPSELAEKQAQYEMTSKQNKKCEDFINAFRLQQATLARSVAANNGNANTNNNNAATISNNASTAHNSNANINVNANINASTNRNSIANQNQSSNTDQVAIAPSHGPTDSVVTDALINAGPGPAAASNLSKTSAPKAQALQRTPSNIGSVGSALAAASAQNSGNTTTQLGSQKSPTSTNPLRNTQVSSAFTPSTAVLPQPGAPGSTIRSSSISGSITSHAPGLQQTMQQQLVPESPAKMSAGTPSTTPVIQREGASAHRLPIPKTLSMPAPTAVVVPPSRPTLTGGTHAPSGSQVVGGPAMAKAPQFELDEASGGLLSKRKLHELVKQIDPNETLDPEVEESILELTEDFVDTLLTYACRMAKHRGSDTLDIRDIQMILERNWNIRIPGYSMDDIRTVRKFNPTPSYQQKLQALQAGKALNQSETSKDA
ncbi:hypothetical protein ABW21_db0202096 [Orbilia brochopaga]|nr:hypothetical protein ABW21_db0202096 [Drechslerella brochopaga]